MAALLAHVHGAWACILLALWSRRQSIRRRKRHLNRRELTWLGGGAFAVFALGSAIRAARVSSSPATTPSISFGRALVIQGLGPDVTPQLASWGVLVPVLLRHRRPAGKGISRRSAPLLGLTLVAALFNVVRLSSPLGPSHRLTLAAAAAIAAIVASSYFVLFKFSYIHNSLVSALFLQIAARGAASATAGRDGWYSPCRRSSALRWRGPAARGAAMLLVLAFAAAGEGLPAVAWRHLVLPYCDRDRGLVCVPGRVHRRGHRHPDAAARGGSHRHHARDLCGARGAAGARSQCCCAGRRRSAASPQRSSSPDAFCCLAIIPGWTSAR